ncbi:hypothetical protein LCM17_14780 [Cereibacter sphaeroides]|nr:hypothetical protein [Cereibacter sphaeroides]
MSLATPASVSPGSPRQTAASGARRGTAGASLLALFPASIVAGTGLGLALLALLAPPPSVGPLPPLDASLAQATEAGVEADTPHAVWAPLFGERLSAAPVAPPPPVEEDEEDLALDTLDDSLLVLRGLALADDPAEAFAIVEGYDGIEIVRVGDMISGEFEVLAILSDGLEVASRVTDELFLIEFDDDRRPEDAGDMGASSRDVMEDEDLDAYDENMDDEDDFADDPAETVMPSFGAPPRGPEANRYESDGTFPEDDPVRAPQDGARVMSGTDRPAYGFGLSR